MTSIIFFLHFQQQHLDKTITINQYQKRIEIFFQEWANHALRSYINSMSGVHDITVDEKTRRRIMAIEESQANTMKLTMQQELGPELASTIPDETYEQTIIDIDNDKVSVDFDTLSSDLLSFEVRSGSLIENERELERNNIQEMLVSTSQMMGNISDENRPAFENVIMQLVMRLAELSDIDISASVSSTINERLMMQALQSTMGAVMDQQNQIQQMQQMLAAQQPQQQLPPEAAQPPMPMEQAPMEQMPPEAPMPMEQPPMEQMPPEAAGMPEDMMPMPEEEEMMM